MTAESALDEEAEEAQPILHRKRHRNLGQRLLKALFVVAGSMVVILAFFTVALLLLYLFMNAFTSSPLK